METENIKNLKFDLKNEPSMGVSLSSGISSLLTDSDSNIDGIDVLGLKKYIKESLQNIVTSNRPHGEDLELLTELITAHFLSPYRVPVPTKELGVHGFVITFAPVEIEEWVRREFKL